jgi:hypothetical protein
MTVGGLLELARQGGEPWIVTGDQAHVHRQVLRHAAGISTVDEAAAQEIARGAPPARGNGGLGHASPTPQRRDLVGSEAIVRGLAAVNRPHIAGMAQDEGHPLVFVESGPPGPR